MDSLVSQHPAAYSQFAIQVDAHAFPPSSSSASSSASSSSSRSAAHAYAADAYDHRYASSQRYPPPPSSSSSSQHQHQHASPSLQIQTATPAPHEHEPDEQTAHPARLEQQQQQQQYSTGTDAEMQGQGQSIADALTDAPGPHGGLSRPLTLQERELLNNLDKLKFFLATAPSRWNAADPSSSTALPPAPFGLNMGMNSAMGVGMGMNVNMNMNGGGLAMGQIAPAGHPHSTHPALNRFLLPNQEYVSCVLWGGLYHITGTDIVRALVFRFEAFGRPVRNMKKFEEGVFSDLRNLKPGVDACLEEPKSPFLDLLFKYQCIRTQKKQKVFYWFSVPHDRLFLDALERDLKREKMGHEPTTHVVGEPALSFTYDPKRSLYEQFSKVHGAREGEGELEAAVRRADEARGTSDDGAGSSDGRARSVASSDAEHSASEADADEGADEAGSSKKKPSALSGPNSPFFPMFSLFEGSPTYKQRRKKVPKGRKSSPTSDGSASHSNVHGHPLHPLAHQSLLGAGMYTIAQQHQQTQQQQGFREPHVDRFGRDVLRLSAEDMFAAGARGEFGANPDIVVSQKERQARAMAAAAAQDKQLPYPGGLSGPGVSGAAPPQAPPQPQDGMDVVYGIPATASALAGSLDYTQQQQQQSQQQYAQGMHPRPQLEQRHTYPMVDFAQHAHARTATEPSYALSAGQQQQQMPAGWSAADVGMEMEGTPRTKAFVCPLFSCGRMFKRMEHLRRHLRTHTLERPFQCDQCQKRFSRSDNLAQHVRTHDRRAAAAAAMGQMGMAVGVPDGGEADAEDELETDELDRELQYMSGVNGITSVRMCEVEVQGAVHEVQGDEEGLLTTSGSVALTGGAAPADGGDVEGQRQALYYDSTGQILRASPETSPYLAGQPSPDSQWVSVPAASLPLPQQPQQPPASAFAGGATPNSLHLANARLDASYHTGSMGDYVTSISAPSHKLTFDHAALYPHELALNGPGPIRRHRSATPSIPRYGESIRRPYSAAMSDSGNTTVGATPASAPNSRSYHPYAMAGHHAVSHSAQSSPMAYTVPLSGGYDAAPVRHAAHSRSSSSGQLQEQMRHMLSLEQIDAGSMAAQYAAVQEGQQQQQQQSYAGMYRTDSPMPYSGVGDAYEMEIAHQHQHQHPHQQPAYLQDQYVAQQQLQHQQQSEYYAHPHHSL